MKIWGLAVALASVLTLGLVNPAQAAGSINIYSEYAVSQITINVSTASATSLASAPKVYVPATVTISQGLVTLSRLTASMHLKGSSTLKQNPSLTSNRPSIRVKFDIAALTARGIQTSYKTLTLNSMYQDSSKIHEYSAYKLFNAMNVPAPRVGYAKVKVIIGTRTYDKGLYAVIEPYDSTFLKAHFTDKTQHLYENCGLFDDITKAYSTTGGAACLTTASVYETKIGWSKYPNKRDLAALKSAQTVSANYTWWVRMGQLTDRSELIRMWAVENFISSWDSYSGPTVNNYYLRSSTTGVFSMLPFGTDESFGSQTSFNFSMIAPNIGYPLIKKDFTVSTLKRGSMFVRCVKYVTCRNEYLDALKQTSAQASRIGLISQMRYIGTVISKYAPTAGWAQQNTRNWVSKKQLEVKALLKLYSR